MTNRPTLTIDRLSCRVRLAAGGANPGDARDAVERAAGEALSVALADLPLPDGDDSVVRLRDLRLSLAAAPGAEPDEALAARWGRAIGVALLRVLRDDDPARVVRFDSPQAYTLHFLRDLSDGRAWNQWYYGDFAPLRHLPDAQAALALLISRPAWAVALLRELLRDGRGLRLLARWSAADIARLWAALGLTDAGRPTTDALEVVIHHALPGLLRTPSGTGDDARARDVLRLWLAAPLADDAALAAARLLVDVAALLRLVPEARGLLLMQTPFYPAIVAKLAAAGAGGWLGALPDSDDGRALLAVAAAAVTPGARPVEAAGAGDELSSPVGGVFLLLAALPGPSLWEQWLAADGEEAARRYLFVLALKALGDHATGHFDDPLLAAFAGLDEPPPADPGPGFAWLLPDVDDMLTEATARTLRRFAVMLPRGFEASSPGYLAANFLAHPGTLRREADVWRVTLDGGPLRMVLRMAAWPERMHAPWLPAAVELGIRNYE